MPALKGKQMGGNHLAGKVCTGCGASGKVHRPDCTRHPSDLRCTAPGCPAVRKAGVKTPVWGYAPSTGYLCPEHK